ncbi:MAG: arginase [Planctomycetota bacterium]|nr:arginase [Planctomycetota bacterium]MEE2659990.1 arginase [Planctomycetota bacterium]
MPVPPRDIHVIGVPLDLGQSLRGVDIGPGAVRYAGLGPALRALGHTVTDLGDIEIPKRDQLNPDQDPAFAKAIAEVSAKLCAQAEASATNGATPIFVGGDHAMSIGSVSGVTAAGRTGILWIDAHGDLNTPDTSPSGNIHGMPLATLLGTGLPDLVQLGGRNPKVLPEDVVLLAIRELDPGERAMALDHGLKVLTMRDIDERGIAKVVREALDHLGHTERLHVSLDLDSLDPSVVPGVGTPVPGGLTYREAQLICETIADSGRMTSLDLVEVNPLIGDHNRTAEVAVRLTESLFGKAIL